MSKIDRKREAKTTNAFVLLPLPNAREPPQRNLDYTFHGWRGRWERARALARGLSYSLLFFISASPLSIYTIYFLFFLSSRGLLGVPLSSTSRFYFFFIWCTGYPKKLAETIDNREPLVYPFENFRSIVAHRDTRFVRALVCMAPKGLKCIKRGVWEKKLHVVKETNGRLERS